MSPENTRRALDVRNRGATLLVDRMGLVRSAVRFVFRNQPEIAREWMRIASQVNGAAFDPSRPLSLPELVASVPVNPNAFLRLSSPPISHGELKRRMENYFISTAWATPRLR